MLRIKDEADRCLNCKNPRCVAGCPVHTPIPQSIALFKLGKVNEAARQLFDNNPLSLVCAIVCPHERQCEGHCVRGIKSTPVGWSEIEKYLSDTALDKMKIDIPASTGKHIAVIGGGPGGITAAVKLRQKGHEVTIFESRSLLGGMMQYGIPEFRLPKSILRRYEKKLAEMGVNFRMHTAIGDALKISDLQRDGYDAVLIASGLWRAKPLGIPGESLPNVCFGIHYLSSPDSFQIGERLAVIGTGNTAMDVARTALHRGVEHVTMYARSGRIAADEAEKELAELEGAAIETGMQISRITSQGPMFKKCTLDEDGKVISMEDEEVLEPADFVIIAASQGPKSKLINTTEGLEGTDKGLLKVDEKGMTTADGVFAVGDVVYGGRTVVEAVRDAKNAAEAIDEYLKNKE